MYYKLYLNTFLYYFIDRVSALFIFYITHNYYLLFCASCILSTVVSVPTTYVLNMELCKCSICACRTMKNNGKHYKREGEKWNFISHSIVFFFLSFLFSFSFDFHFSNECACPYLWMIRYMCWSWFYLLFFVHFNHFVLAKGNPKSPLIFSVIFFFVNSFAGKY